MNSYLVTIQSDALRHIILSPGSKVRLSISDPQSQKAAKIHLSAIVSDHESMALSGTLRLFSIGTSGADVDTFANLYPDCHGTLQLSTVAVDMEVIRNLSGELRNTISFTGFMTVRKNFDGATNRFHFTTSGAVLSTSVFTVISDWSEKTLGEVSKLTLDEMIYKEV